MAKQEQLDLFQKGVEEWNAWRALHPEIAIDLSKANLIGADLIGVDLNRANLSEARFNEAYLNRANLIGANLTGANLSEAYLNKANLSGADLSRTDLIGAYFNEATLRGTNLDGAILHETHFRRANLQGASLQGVDLRGAYLSEANLSNSNLSRADLSSVDLHGADLSHAIVAWTVFGNLDLRNVKSLETIRHLAPSTLGTNTLERSEGDIPETFLRGIGLNDTFITYIRSLHQSPIRYYTCFISYSSKDELFAMRLHNDLQQEGVRCWFAPEDMDIGDKIKHRIDESIRLYDKLLLILSEHSITSSWVAYEVERALKKEPTDIPNVLYPVLIDQAISTCTTDWARDIKETRHIGDFECWTDPEKYQASFQRLLRALRGKPEQGKD